MALRCFPRLVMAAKTTGRRPLSDMSAFRSVFKQAKHVVALTGAGISAESGVPTFRGAGGLWRRYSATAPVEQDLATPQAFAADSGLVWEFYNYRRQLVLQKKPNPAHLALAEAERRLAAEGRRLVVITQNIDELHQMAGSTNLIELHGTLFKTRCMKCGDVAVNRSCPITPAFRDRVCSKCSGLLRPNVVWFGESLDPSVTTEAQKELDNCDLCLIFWMKSVWQIGTSSQVYPAAMYAPQVATRGIPVAEFNIAETPKTECFG
ncbi:SIRT5 [Cordylochernes scorpioides]|uniref:SIRT5 n=1 Tax=Cordylochernes scorpioides TaxID=51811 RepID=A0ABY6KVM4_9ARAC|nr:SIRT5 [Cordylochernes scorpioides]